MMLQDILMAIVFVGFVVAVFVIGRDLYRDYTKHTKA